MDMTADMAYTRFSYGKQRRAEAQKLESQVPGGRGLCEFWLKR